MQFWRNGLLLSTVIEILNALHNLWISLYINLTSDIKVENAGGLITLLESVQYNNTYIFISIIIT